MSESTEIANAVYYLASTIREGVTMLGITAIMLWAGAMLLGGADKNKSE